MLVALAAAVAGGESAFFARSQIVPHIVSEHSVFYKNVSRTGTTFVVDRQVTPLARHRAVVDQGHQWTGDELSDLAGIHRTLLQDGVGFKAGAACLVEQDPSGTTGQYDGQITRRCGTRVQLGDRL